MATHSKKCEGAGVSGNYQDIQTGEEYWVSGVKKHGKDRHWSGSGPVLIEKEAVSEYLQIRGINELDPKNFQVTESIIKTNIEHFKEIENLSLWNTDCEEDDL